MSAFRRPLIATAPTRLDFGGGWTDVPPYPEDRGGFVCNLAITRFATVRVSPTPPRGATVAGTPPLPPIVQAALARSGQASLHVSLTSDFPVGAGLGGSSAAGVALVAALKALAGEMVDTSEARDRIAEESRAVEVEELGIAGGRQDHYAAAHGGALGISFGQRTVATPIPLTQPTRNALEERCLVGYTGESRISGATITAVLDAYLSREPRVVSALEQMKGLALQMRDALAAGDVDVLGQLVGEHWVHQRALHPGITTERIDALERAVRSAGAIGLKALGASGGGCVVVFAPEGGHEAIADAMRPFSTLLPWRVADHGVVVREQTGVMARPTL